MSTLAGTQPPKPLIVLVHGGASSNRMYRKVIPHLEQSGFECVAPDLPGHGSEAEGGPFTFEAANRIVTKAITGKQSSASEQHRKAVLVGISLGGQVVLSFLTSGSASLVDAAIVSGVSIGPPDEDASWEMPHMPADREWLDLMMEDVNIAGMKNMPDLQAKSLSFTFNVAESTTLPPVLVVIGQNDVAMAKRDFDALTKKVKNANHQSDSLIMQDAWHNHSIDVPDRFSRVILDWAETVW